MKKIASYNECQKILTNIQFLASLNDFQRKYVLSLMIKGIYDICPLKLKELEEIKCNQ